MTPRRLVVGVTGATGHLGGQLLERLVRDPAVQEVRSVARRALLRPGGMRPSGEGTARLAHTQADLNEPAARSALEGVDLLYHLAAQVWQSRGAAGPLQMRTTNVEGTRNMLLARPGAFVFASSVSVYGAWPDNPLPMDEADQPRPNLECPYAQQKLASERACAELAGRWAVLRLSAVLGPHADARVARAVRAYRWAVPAVSGAGQALQWLDEGDAVEGLLAAGRSLVTGGDADGQVLNLATADWLGPGDMAELAHSRVVELPRRVLVAMSELGKQLGITPFGSDRAALIGGPLAVSAAKAHQVLGWQPSKSSAEVLAAALERDWRGSPRNRLIIPRGER
ncbi:MAG TPA: NAD-dependent epimerase/dehydratase family protein [Acidimicrobiales bacterium]|nr:NAD-dependent epimerase/dehydratase family protein [Acidimicrobiales bacterium]